MFAYEALILCSVLSPRVLRASFPRCLFECSHRGLHLSNPRSSEFLHQCQLKRQWVSFLRHLSWPKILRCSFLLAKMEIRVKALFEGVESCLKSLQSNPVDGYFPSVKPILDTWHIGPEAGVGPTEAGVGPTDDSLRHVRFSPTVSRIPWEPDFIPDRLETAAMTGLNSQAGRIWTASCLLPCAFHLFSKEILQLQPNGSSPG